MLCIYGARVRAFVSEGFPYVIEWEGKKKKKGVICVGVTTDGCIS